jgi:four helix bundle protein
LAESLANQIWEIVKKWDYFTKDAIGKQIVRSADSVCANIAEGRGRYSPQTLTLLTHHALRSVLSLTPAIKAWGLEEEDSPPS